MFSTVIFNIWYVLILPRRCCSSKINKQSSLLKHPACSCHEEAFLFWFPIFAEHWMRCGSARTCWGVMYENCWICINSPLYGFENIYTLSSGSVGLIYWGVLILSLVQCNFVIHWFLCIGNIPFSQSEVVFCNAWRYMTPSVDHTFVVLLKNFGTSFKSFKGFCLLLTDLSSFLLSKRFWKWSML